MRSLLLGLVPLACTVSTAAPLDREPAQPTKKIAAPSGPIIERGEGCSAEIADDEVAAYGAPGRGRGGGAAVTGGAARLRKSASAKLDMADGEGAADVAMAPPPAAVAPTTPTAPAAPKPPAPAKAAPSGAPAPERMPMVQAPAGVRAGEWDDNANYRDYVGWLSSTARGVSRLDVSARQFLVVTDRDGKAMPNCKIDVRGQKGAASLVTMASGRAMVFPGALGIGADLTATASCPGAAPVTGKLDARTLDGVAHLKLDVSRQLPARRTVDLAFVLDTTGSMAEEIEAVKETIRTVADKLSTAQTDVRIGLVEYKDRTDCMLTRTFPFSSDLRAFGAQVASISASGGGDTPEDMHAGLAAALDKLQWRSDAVARMVVVIADAPPHLDYQNQRDYADAAKRAAARGIKLYSVSASGMDDTGQVVMRQLAQLTGGSNMFVLRGGAGPQSVGGGDPKSSCGGTHEDFSSGNLDQLIMRKIRVELASLDADPLKIPGRGQDENAKPCSQRLVLAN
ncbi:MAG TPA: vWA domain-containing protein [Kofleriaceae bacterium]|nr:vWA domain-containing protein [Kofleriaceae bacterium]